MVLLRQIIVWSLFTCFIHGAQWSPASLELENSIISISEGDQAGKELFVLSVVSAGGNVQYSMQSAFVSLRIKQSTGAVSLTSSIPDYELFSQISNGTQTFIFQAYVDNTYVQPDLQIEYTVMNYNDESPEILNLADFQTFHVTEGVQIGTVLFDIKATDKDGPSLSYSFLSNGPNGNPMQAMHPLYINITTGEVTLDSELDYEQDQLTTNFWIRVSDNDVENPLKTTASFLLHIGDIQDTPPEFRPTEYHFTVAEDTSINAQLQPSILAEDGDATSKHDIAYSFLSPEAVPFFGVDSSSGVVFVSGALDAELLPATIEVAVLATELCVTAPCANSTATVYFYIENVNDLPPVFSHGQYQGSIDENPPLLSVVSLDQPISVSDPDMGQSQLQLRLGDATLAQYLTVNPASTGLAKAGTLTVTITVRDPVFFDYESRRNVATQLWVSDGVHEASASLSISIANRNDLPPAFQLASYTVSVREDTPTRSPFRTVTALDGDNDASLPPLEYSFCPPGNPNFTIDAASGEIALAVPLDYELATTHYLELCVWDGQFQHQAPLVVNVGDVNDVTPEFEQDVYYGVFEENTVFFSLQLQAFDGDGSSANNQLLFTIDSQSTGQWQVYPGPNSAYGVQTLTPARALDREQIPPGNITLVMLVTDNGQPPRYSNTTVVLSVIDVNDKYPSFALDQYHFTIPENQAKGVVFGSVSAVDLDYSDAFSEVNYRLLSTADNRFNIDPISGQLSVR